MCTAAYLFMGFIMGFLVCDAIIATVILLFVLNDWKIIKEFLYSNP